MSTQEDRALEDLFIGQGSVPLKREVVVRRHEDINEIRSGLGEAIRVQSRRQVLLPELVAKRLGEVAQIPVLPRRNDKRQLGHKPGWYWPGDPPNRPAP